MGVIAKKVYAQWEVVASCALHEIVYGQYDRVDCLRGGLALSNIKKLANYLLDRKCRVKVALSENYCWIPPREPIGDQVYYGRDLFELCCVAHPS